MTAAQPLPEVLTTKAFHIAEAFGAGISASRLRASDLEIPTRGVRVVRAIPTAAIEEPRQRETASQRLERMRQELFTPAEQFAPALTPDQFYSHDTGLALVGTPLPYTDDDEHLLHVSARRPASQPRREGLTGHRLQRRTAVRWTARGLPIEHPARIWRQAGSSWELDDLIAAADHLVCPRRKLLTLDDLRAEIVSAGDVRGGILSRALEEVRIGAETAGETELRLLLTRAGLPEPEVNWTLRATDGRFVARLDLAHRKYRVAPEHDGRTHAFDEAQFARDADRWDDIRAQGWNHVRILSHRMRPDPRVALDRVTTALWAAGWRPV